MRYFDAAGERHRDDGPATIHPVEKSWWRHGEVHRVGGPAVVNADGFEQWVQDGRRHRVDGPAFVHRRSSRNGLLAGAWMVRGEELSFPQVLSVWLDQGHPGWDESLRLAMWVAMEVWPADATMADLYAEVTGGEPSGMFRAD